MNGLLGEIGKKLAERWVSLLALPGLLFLGSAIVAVTLGHSHALDVGMLSERITKWSTAPGKRSFGAAALLLTSVLLGSVMVGVVATALGSAVEMLWTLPGERRPASWLADRRRKRSRDAKEAADTAQSPEQLARAIATADRICLVEANRPTWIGDRLRVPYVRVALTYNLDLDACWPRLWLIVSADTRSELEAGRDSLASAARLGAWAVLYLALGFWWWPAVAVAVVLQTSALIKGRMSAANLADLVEASVDLHVGDIADQLRLDLVNAPGQQRMLNSLLRKSRWDPESPVAQ
ncbi:MAG TPA: hypothetical protein VFV01_04190 [Spirillospora sp.]|nr:hypothetical protein [Spirillospora sp.]